MPTPVAPFAGKVAVRATAGMAVCSRPHPAIRATSTTAANDNCPILNLRISFSSSPRPRPFHVSSTVSIESLWAPEVPSCPIQDSWPQYRSAASTIWALSPTIRRALTALAREMEFWFCSRLHPAIRATSANAGDIFPASNLRISVSSSTRARAFSCLVARPQKIRILPLAKKNGGSPVQRKLRLRNGPCRWCTRMAHSFSGRSVRARQISRLL